MSHDYHDGPADAVLYDGCDECDRRASKPLDGLFHLDQHNFALLVQRVRAVEFDYAESYRTDNEAKLGTALYRILVLAERHPEAIHA